LLNETKNDVVRAIELQSQANQVRRSAFHQLAQTESVMQKLEDSTSSENLAGLSIQTTLKSIESAKEDLYQVFMIFFLI